MKIEMLLYASLGKLAPDKKPGSPFYLELEDGSTVLNALEQASIPTTIPMIIFVNGRHSRLDGGLGDGDRLAIFPPIAGG